MKNRKILQSDAKIKLMCDGNPTHKDMEDMDTLCGSCPSILGKLLSICITRKCYMKKISDEGLTPNEIQNDEKSN